MVNAKNSIGKKRQFTLTNVYDDESGDEKMSSSSSNESLSKVEPLPGSQDEIPEEIEDNETMTKRAKFDAINASHFYTVEKVYK